MQSFKQQTELTVCLLLSIRSAFHVVSFYVVIAVGKGVVGEGDSVTSRTRGTFIGRNFIDRASE